MFSWFALPGLDYGQLLPNWQLCSERMQIQLVTLVNTAKG